MPILLTFALCCVMQKVKTKIVGAVGYTAFLFWVLWRIRMVLPSLKKKIKNYY